jgi:hypothetical protein
MNILITLFIFLLVLFLYLHITHQYKRSEDLEIYELDYTHNAYLQEVCNVKQPIVFDFAPLNKEQFFVKSSEKELIIKDTNDYYEPKTNPEYVVLPFESAQKLFKNDANAHYFTENNHEFAEETFPLLEEIDSYLKPSLIVQTKYDYCTGSSNCATPLRYHTNYRQFYAVTRGKISIKMAPFQYSKYLHPHKDYDTMEFRSPINVWTPQPPFLNEMDKIKFLEFDVLKGRVLYIPPYWWYSIRYCDDETTMIGFTYHSLMNLLANTPDYVQSFLQQQNTKIKTTMIFDRTMESPVGSGVVRIKDEASASLEAESFDRKENKEEIVAEKEPPTI